jgi:hypothetical protein
MSPNPSNPTDTSPGPNPGQAAAESSLAPAFDTASLLAQRCYRAYRRDLPELLKSHKGQWVAYRGDQQLGFGRSKAKLIKACLRRGVPSEEFDVFCVQPYYPDEDIVYFGVD